MNNDQKNIIQTERLILRPVQEGDFEELCLLDTDPEVRSFFPEGPLEVPHVRLELDRFKLEWEKLGFGIFAILDKKSNQFMGRCGFARLRTGEVEVGYILLKEFWGQGIATEVAKALLPWGFKNIATDRIEGWAPVTHKASLRILEKCGMIFDKFDTYQGIPCAFYYLMK